MQVTDLQIWDLGGRRLRSQATRLPCLLKLPQPFSVSHNLISLSFSLNLKILSLSKMKPLFPLPHFFLLFFIITNTFCVNIAAAVHGRCFEDQQLLHLKKSLTFAPESSEHPASTKFISWNSSTDCCSWAGVTCNANGSVVGLDISSKNISGGIDNSSTLFHLQHLQSLNLADNSFVNGSRIPSSIGKLTNLMYLNLSDSGKIPIEISRLTRLVVLDISLCKHQCATKLESPNLSMLFQNLTEITELYLDGINISAQGSQWCQAISSSLPNLRALSMCGSQLSGPFCQSLAKLQSLSVIQLDSNDIYGPIPGFFPKLTSLSLRNCILNGTFPKEIFQVPTLQAIDLSGNIHLHGSFPEFLENASLGFLDLSHTKFSGLLPDSIGNLKLLSILNLYNCSFSGSIPKSMASLTKLFYLDMSSNMFNGSIDSIYWKKLVNLEYLALDSNFLTGSIPSSLFSSSSLLQLTLSHNRFSGLLHEISTVDSSTLFNLDLSFNSLSGMIPQSLSAMSSLQVLNLRRNNLTGSISDFEFPESLEFLELNQNQIHGQFPKSLAQCSELQVVNLENNQITDTFPCLLRNISSLRVLALRSNKFYGRIGCPEETNGIWPMLQIIDIAHNNFHGEIPGSYLKAWQAMINNEDDNPSTIRLLPFEDPGVIHYQETITVVSKGLEIELVKILTIFTSIDFSCNNLSGPIPKEMGELKSLYLLNLSSNAFTGEIPSSFGNMRQLESLDLSQNKLSGKIPPQLAKLNFLSFLNLSNNQLVGRIPTGPQFSTFTSASFTGNKGLWGPPLTVDSKAVLLSPPPTLTGSVPSSRHEIDWDLINVEIGFVCGFGVVVGSLVLCKRWSKWYYKTMYKILVKIFPQLEDRIGRHRRHVHINQRLGR
ncbi:unnamed protein product [Malus baccata var. baccata]